VAKENEMTASLVVLISGAVTDPQLAQIRGASPTADVRYFSRREDLERLLADSGLDMRSSDVRDVIRPLPPVERTTAALPAR
jgi:hypothetical protein